VALLRRLWWGGGDREPLTVPDALRRAEQSRREGRYAEAGALVARALELDPDNLHAHLLAAYLHVARRAPAPAKAEFHWVLDRDANHARALLGLARIALEEGDAHASHDLLRRALRFYPDFPEAMIENGVRDAAAGNIISGNGGSGVNVGRFRPSIHVTLWN